MSQLVGRPANTRRLRVETLEDRTVPSWTVPPTTISGTISVTPVTFNASGDATGSAAITSNEIDWYRVTVAAGSATFASTNPGGTLDTVLAVYTTAGQRVTYNDDINYPSNLNSRATATLSAGTYYVGVTNYTGSRGGAYTWSFHAAVPTTPPTVPPPPAPSPPPPSPPPPPPTAGSFNITVRTSGLTASQQAAFATAAARWQAVITGDIPDATYNGLAVDDVLIDASGAAIDGAGGILGQAGPDRLRSGSLLPIHGVMQFDTADLAAMQANGSLVDVITHEMGHVLGIGTIWQQKGLLSGAGGSNPLFTGAQATAAYDAIFHTTGAVPVENSGGSGTRDSHWRETTFGNELMTGYLNSGSNPLSRVTVASLADLGYTVNLNAADPYTPPSGGSGLRAGGGGGSGTSGGAGLRAASDWEEAAGGEMLDTDPVVDGAGIRPDWQTASTQPDAAVTTDPLPVRWTPTTAVAEADRPTTPASNTTPPRWMNHNHAAADELLLGVAVG